MAGDIMSKKLAPKDMRNVVDIFVNVIPCFAYVHDYQVVKPNLKADNPLDYFGYTELEYTLYDRKGYRAHWLDKIEDKKGLADETREQILNKLQED